MLYTITPEQLAAVRAARLTLLDSPHASDHKVAEALEWAETLTPHAPIARLTIAHPVIGVSLYAPGLPDGEHDVYL